jgi:hypothetical protein
VRGGLLGVAGMESFSSVGEYAIHVPGVAG